MPSTTLPSPAASPGDQVSRASPSRAHRTESVVAGLGGRRSCTAPASATNTGTLPMVVMVATLTEVDETAAK